MIDPTTHAYQCAFLEKRAAQEFQIELLRLELNTRGISDEEFCGLLGITVGRFDYLLSGVMRPPADFVADALAALQLLSV